MVEEEVVDEAAVGAKRTRSGDEPADDDENAELRRRELKRSKVCNAPLLLISNFVAYLQVSHREQIMFAGSQYPKHIEVNFENEIGNFVAYQRVSHRK